MITGLFAGLNAARLARAENLLTLPDTTMLGALLKSITDPTRIPFQPMNANMGVLPPVLQEGDKKKLDKAVCNERMSLRSQAVMSQLTC